MERFFNKIRKEENGCWNWIAAKRGNGYGAFKFKNKIVSSHRFSFMFFNNLEVIEKDIFVCHKCDNRSCVNPDHLFLGTQSDNMKDALRKGRLVIPLESKFIKGSVPKNSLITKEKANEIRNLILNKGSKTLKKLSEELELPYQLIRDINSNRVY